MRTYPHALLSIILFLASCFTRGNAEYGVLKQEMPRGQKGRGADIARVSPGLEEAIVNYQEAKLVYDQAELLVREAEKAVEIAKKRNHHVETSAEQTDNARGDDHQADVVGNRPGLDEPREDKPHINDAPDYEETAASSYVTNGDEIIKGYMETPSICAKDKNAAVASCAENLPICKYKRINNPKGDFIISAELADGEDDTKCIRRCDAKYHLTPEHCGEGLDCITDEVVTCGNCDVLSDKGPCQYFV